MFTDRRGQQVKSLDCYYGSSVDHIRSVKSAF